MSDWIDKINDDRWLRKQEEEIEAEKRGLAHDATGDWARLIINQVQSDVARFKDGPAACAHISISQDNTGAYKVATNQTPLHSVRFSFSRGRIEFVKTSQLTFDAPEAEERGSLFIKARTEQDTWIEHQGKQMRTASAVSEFLLREVLTNAR